MDMKNKMDMEELLTFCAKNIIKKIMATLSDIMPVDNKLRSLLENMVNPSSER